MKGFLWKLYRSSTALAIHSLAGVLSRSLHARFDSSLFAQLIGHFSFLRTPTELCEKKFTELIQSSILWLVFGYHRRVLRLHSGVRLSSPQEIGKFPLGLTANAPQAARKEFCCQYREEFS